MLSISGMKKGIVIDHIQPGCGYKIFKQLGLHKADYTVALLKNVNSTKFGKKDIIKIENEININLEILGLLAPDITINIVENGQVKEKISLKLPNKVKGILQCKNPRCISTVESIDSIEFTLVNEKKKEYKCEYCDGLTTFY